MNITLIVVGSVVFVIVALIYYSMQRMKRMPVVPDNEKIRKLTDANFKKQVSSGITVVDFWAEWCGPCKMMAPVLNKVADETTGIATVCKLNVDHAKQTASKFNVMSIPTIIIFKNGKEGRRIVGVKTKEHIIDQINQVKRKIV